MNIFAHLSVMEILVEIVKNNNGEINAVKRSLSRPKSVAKLDLL